MMRIADRLPRLTRANIHPFVFAVYPVLSFYVNNMTMASPTEALRAVAFMLICAGLLWWLIDLAVRHRAKSGVIVSASATLFFAYGGTSLALTNILVRLQWLERARFLIDAAYSEVLWLALWGILFGAVFLLVARQKSDLHTATRFMNVAALALLAMLGARFATSAQDLLVRPRLRTQWQEQNTPQTIVSAPDELPDIYYIILDAYGRADVLDEVYGLDNSEFLSQLTDRGFYVADHSRSNYAQTTLSLASSLNLGYLDDLIGSLETVKDSRIPMHIMIEDSKLVRFLRDIGYTIVEFESGYHFTRIEHDVQMTAFPRWSPSEFEEGLILLTPLSAVESTWADYRRQRIEYTFEHLADPSRDSRPTFTFVHVLAPHSPILFDADGDPIPPRGQGSHAPVLNNQFIAYYSEQLLYINKKLLPAIDAILSQSTAPPVIIVQADHGPDTPTLGDKPRETVVRERMAILNALYFPRADYESLYEGITPANTFMVLLNQYFNAEYQLLEDRCFYSFYSAPYAFDDVTDLTAK